MIDYVDEEGNRLDPSRIDVNGTFTDDFGRPCDPEGRLLEDPVEEASAVDIAEQLLQGGTLAELLQHGQKYVTLFPENSALRATLGVAYGSSGQLQEARSNLRVALELEGKSTSKGAVESTTLANYLVTCFHGGEIPQGREALELHYADLDAEGQKLILEVTRQAIKLGLLTSEELPSELSREL